MKKNLLYIFILIVFCLVGVYILVPGEIKISNIALTPCIPKNITECLRDQSTWKRWLPTDAAKDYDYTLTHPFTDGAEIELSKRGTNLKTRMWVIPSGRDSSAVEWQTSFTSSYDPLKRVAQWFEAKEIKSNMQNVMDKLLGFAAKTENIYGFRIQRTTFTDTILAAIKFSTSTYPKTEMIYNAINQLKKKINDEG